MPLEKMDEFFDQRVGEYDHHMIVELRLEEFYREIANCFPSGAGNPTLLDLGCGTGLELERLYEKLPGLRVTGIDLSENMLNALRDKFPDKALTLIHDSYFHANLGENRFDYALSTYSLHHFSEEDKIRLYERVYVSLRDNGMYVEGDYICPTMEQQLFHIAENQRLRKENGISGGYYHYDTPFTAATQMRLLRSAGFSDVRLVREWENTGIFVAIK
jgi:tRNA (cmo5U34)-methyltransferase